MKMLAANFRGSPEKLTTGILAADVIASSVAASVIGSMQVALDSLVDQGSFIEWEPVRCGWSFARRLASAFRFSC